jgi:hypothetical protein
MTFMATGQPFSSAVCPGAAAGSEPLGSDPSKTMRRKEMWQKLRVYLTLEGRFAQ